MAAVIHTIANGADVRNTQTASYTAVALPGPVHRAIQVTSATTTTVVIAAVVRSKCLRAGAIVMSAAFNPIAQLARCLLSRLEQVRCDREFLMLSARRPFKSILLSVGLALSAISASAFGTTIQ